MSLLLLDEFRENIKSSANKLTSIMVTMKIMFVLAAIIVGEILIILYILDLLDLKILITSLIILVFSLIIRNMIKERAKHREKNEYDKLSHSKKLVDKELKLRTDTNVGFDNDNLKLCIKEPKSSIQTYEDYSKEIDIHLETGYPEVWNHKNKCDFFINNHNDLAKHLLDTTKEEILRENEKGNLSLTEWNGKGQSPIKYFVPKYLFADVEYIIQHSYEQFFNIDQYCIIDIGDNSLKSNTNGELIGPMIVAEYPEYFKWKLTINHKFAEGDKNDIEELKQIIKLTLNFALTNDDFNKLKKYKKDAEREHTLFLDAIIKIIKSVENGIPLKGECKICKN